MMHAMCRPWPHLRPTPLGSLLCLLLMLSLLPASQGQLSHTLPHVKRQDVSKNKFLQRKATDDAKPPPPTMCAPHARRPSRVLQLECVRRPSAAPCIAEGVICALKLMIGLLTAGDEAPPRKCQMACAWHLNAACSADHSGPPRDGRDLLQRTHVDCQQGHPRRSSQL